MQNIRKVSMFTLLLLMNINFANADILNKEMDVSDLWRNNSGKDVRFCIVGLDELGSEGWKITSCPTLGREWSSDRKEGYVSTATWAYEKGRSSYCYFKKNTANIKVYEYKEISTDDLYNNSSSKNQKNPEDVSLNMKYINKLGEENWEMAACLTLGWVNDGAAGHGRVSQYAWATSRGRSSYCIFVREKQKLSSVNNLEEYSVAIKANYINSMLKNLFSGEDHDYFRKIATAKVSKKQLINRPLTDHVGPVNKI